MFKPKHLFTNSEEYSKMYIDEDKPSQNQVDFLTKVLKDVQKSTDERLVERLSSYLKVSLEDPDPIARHGDRFSRNDSGLYDPLLSRQGEPKHTFKLLNECSPREFAEAAIKMEDPFPCIDAKSVRMLLLDTKNPEICYACRLSRLVTYGIWKPVDEANVLLSTGGEAEPDEYVGVFYETTSKHDLGYGWVGIVERDEPVLSTTLGGYRSAIPIDCVNRYKINWVNWAQQKRHSEPVSKADISRYLSSDIIRLTDPDAKQSLCRSERYEPDWVQYESGNSHRSPAIVATPPEGISVKGVIKKQRDDTTIIDNKAGITITKRGDEINIRTHKKGNKDEISDS